MMLELVGLYAAQCSCKVAKTSVCESPFRLSVVPPAVMLAQGYCLLFSEVAWR